MEYIDGKSLEEYVMYNGALKPFMAFGYIRDVLGAVARMQERFKLCHGDISPDNIMLRSIIGGGSTPVLVDFGAMQKVQEEAGTVESKVAKQYYSAPELLNTNGRVNETTDGFSLCATLYFLLAGEIRRTTIDRYIEELPSLRSMGVNIGPNLEAVIMKGMALKKDNRYENAQALLEAMLAAAKKDKKSRPEWGMEPPDASNQKNNQKKQ
jgi:serine/threonine-protein kinase